MEKQQYDYERRAADLLEWVAGQEQKMAEHAPADSPEQAVTDFQVCFGPRRGCGRGNVGQPYSLAFSLASLVHILPDNIFRNS
jgi:hypothetical protein